MISSPYRPPASLVADPPRKRQHTAPPSATWAVRFLWAAFVIALVQMFPVIVVLARSPAGFAAIAILASLLAGWAFVTRQMGRRSNWARIVFLVMFWLGMAIVILRWQRTLELFRGPPVRAAFATLQYVLQLSAASLLSTRNARRWYRHAQQRADEVSALAATQTNTASSG